MTFPPCHSTPSPTCHSTPSPTMPHFSRPYPTATPLPHPSLTPASPLPHPSLTPHSPLTHRPHSCTCNLCISEFPVRPWLLITAMEVQQQPPALAYPSVRQRARAREWGRGSEVPARSQRGFHARRGRRTVLSGWLRGVRCAPEMVCKVWLVSLGRDVEQRDAHGCDLRRVQRVVRVPRVRAAVRGVRAREADVSFAFGRF